jgi:hypothetical protein
MRGASYSNKLIYTIQYNSSYNRRISCGRHCFSLCSQQTDVFLVLCRLSYRSSENARLFLRQMSRLAIKRIVSRQCALCLRLIALEAGLTAVCYGMFWTCFRQQAMTGCFTTLRTSFTDHINHSNLHFSVCWSQFVTAPTALHGLLQTMSTCVGFNVFKIALATVIPQEGSDDRDIYTICEEIGGMNTRISFHP